MVHGYVLEWYLISGEGDCGEGDCGEGDCWEADCREGEFGNRQLKRTVYFKSNQRNFYLR